MTEMTVESKLFNDKILKIKKLIFDVEKGTDHRKRKNNTLR